MHGGKTDACLPGARAGVEKGISMLIPVLCGAVGFGTVGHLENAVTFSPLQLVMDNEIARYVRRAVQGFEVTDEAINVDLIRQVGIGGNYLSEMDTARQFRDFLDLSPFFAVDAVGRQPARRRGEAVGEHGARKGAATHLQRNPLARSRRTRSSTWTRSSERPKPSCAKRASYSAGLVSGRSARSCSAVNLGPNGEHSHAHRGGNGSGYEMLHCA